MKSFFLGFLEDMDHTPYRRFIYRFAKYARGLDPQEIIPGYLEAVSKIADHVSRVRAGFHARFNKLIVFIKARREPTKKRSITRTGGSEHFKEAHNEAIGR
jgi:hypothetical protein